MKIQKTIKCGIIGLTIIKERLLREEYENLQKFLEETRRLGVILHGTRLNGIRKGNV